MARDHDDLVSSFLDRLLLQHRVQFGVDFVFNVLDQDRHAVFKAEPNVLHELAGHSSYLQVLFFLGQDPAVGLALRVNHEREATRSGHHDAVLGAEVVLRQSLQVPFRHSRFFDQKRSQVQTQGHRDRAAGQILDEVVFHQHVSELRVESSTIAHKRSRYCDVSNESSLQISEVLRVFSPSGLFVSQSHNQFIRLVSLPLQLVHVLLEYLLLVVFFREISLKFGQNVLRGFELSFSP